MPRLYKLGQPFYRLADRSAGTSVHACSHSSNRKGSICSSQRQTASENVLERHHRKPALEGPHPPATPSAPAGAMGSEGWPAPPAAMEAGRAFLQSAAQQAKRVLIVPDKDADGLCAGSIIARTLSLLGCTAGEADMPDQHLKSSHYEILPCCVCTQQQQLAMMFGPAYVTCLYARTRA